MSLKQCKIIYNDINNPLFKYPENTLLDIFPFELWEIILKYYNKTIFIGYHGREYKGFRKMINTDVTDNLKNEFIDCILHGFNVHNFDSVNHLLLVDDHYFLINDCKCLLTYNDVKKGWNFQVMGGYKCHEIRTMSVSLEEKQLKYVDCYATFFIPDI